MSNGTHHDASSAATFRSKASFMKTWRPENTPSNRDRLELYALHKQAVSGDAPTSISSNATVAEKAKFQAWRGKRGITQQEAMSLYIAECDRQVRVYGNIPQTPSNTPAVEAQEVLTPRGLAAVPLLCAAAAESRVAYLRRLGQTTPETAWWSRQEPLCASPGTIGALPELVLLFVASFVEHVSLMQGSLVQSFFWPLHNTLLAVWVALILVLTIVGAAFTLASTILWGARRTGISLTVVWREEIEPSSQAVATLTEGHQPMSIRLVGLFLLPYGTLEGLVNVLTEMVGYLWASVVYVIAMVAVTWWYWVLVVPWLCLCLLGAAAMSGTCFALIDCAGI